MQIFGIRLTGPEGVGLGTTGVFGTTVVAEVTGTFTLEVPDFWQVTVIPRDPAIPPGVIERDAVPLEFIENFNSCDFPFV